MNVEANARKQPSDSWSTKEVGMTRAGGKAPTTRRIEGWEWVYIEDGKCGNGG
jgi:hypothetical protein